MFNTENSIKYPIIQAPMAGGIVSPHLVAQVSNFGMLGSIPSGYLTLEETEDFIVAVKKQTALPFQLNIFVETEIATEKETYQKPQELIALEKKIGAYRGDTFETAIQPKTEAMINLALKHQIPIVSSTFGLFNKNEIEKLHASNIFVVATVNSRLEAETAIATGVDALILQNEKAGGHRGGCVAIQKKQIKTKQDVAAERDTLVWRTMQSNQFWDENINDEYEGVTDVVGLKKKYPRKYFIKAGGVVDKNDVNEALQEGYDGVQIGTGFLTTHESNADVVYKKILLEIRHRYELVTTKNITGRKARGVRNVLATLKTQNELGYPQMHYATKGIRKFAKDRGLIQYRSFWAGDGVVKIKAIPHLNQYMHSLVYASKEA